LLKPLGNPMPNSVKYFATVDILEFSKDRAWLGKATNAVSQHWKEKNLERERQSLPKMGSGSLSQVGSSA
jgi:hypothetical protein